MAVHRVEIPIFKFLALGVGIRDALLHLPGEKVVLRGDVSESTRAFEGFEKMTGVNVSNALIGMKLKELLAGSGTAQTAQYAELTIVDVGNVSAAVLACGLWIDIGDGGEETTGEFSIEVMVVRHNFFRNLTTT